MAKRAIKKHPTITIDHHKAIAKVVVEVSRMEWLVEVLFKGCMHKRSVSGRAIMGALKQWDGFSKVVKASMHEMLPGETAAINKLFAEMNEVRGQRHEIVHSQWGVQGKRVYMCRIRPYAVMPVTYKTALQIDAVAEKASDLCAALIQWQDAVHDVIGASAKTQGQMVPASEFLRNLRKRGYKIKRIVSIAS